MLIPALRCSLRTHLRNRPQGWGRWYLARRRCSFVVFEREHLPLFFSRAPLLRHGFQERENIINKEEGVTRTRLTSERPTRPPPFSSPLPPPTTMAIAYLNFQPRTTQLLHVLPPTQGSDERQGGEEGTFRRKALQEGTRDAVDHPWPKRRRKRDDGSHEIKG